MQLVITDQHIDFYLNTLKSFQKKNKIKLIIILTYTVDKNVTKLFQKVSHANIIVIYGSHGKMDCTKTNPVSNNKIIFLKSHPKHGRMHAKGIFIFAESLQFIISTNNITEQKRSINAYCKSKVFEKRLQQKKCAFKNDLIDFFNCFSDRIHHMSSKITKHLFNLTLIDLLKNYNIIINDAKIKLIKSIPSYCSTVNTGFNDIIKKLPNCHKVIIQPTTVGNNLNQVIPGMRKLSKKKVKHLKFILPPLLLESRLLRHRLSTVPEKYELYFKKLKMKYKKNERDPFVLHMKSIIGLDAKQEIICFGILSANLSKGAMGYHCCKNNVIHFKKNFEKCNCKTKTCNKTFATKNFELGVLFCVTQKQSRNLKNILPFIVD